MHPCTSRKKKKTQLEQDLEAGALKGGDDDSAVVARVLEVYLKPMQETMLRVTPVMQLAGREARERVRLLPSIMQVRVRLQTDQQRFFSGLKTTRVSTSLWFCFLVAHAYVSGVQVSVVVGMSKYASVWLLLRMFPFR